MMINYYSFLVVYTIIFFSLFVKDLTLTYLFDENVNLMYI